MERTPREPESSDGIIPDTVIQHAVRCAACGYNLTGLPVDGQCPECGLSTWESVRRVVDPKVRHMPRLRNPRGVGAAMVWLTVCLLLGALSWVARPIVHAIDSFGGTAWQGRVPTTLPLLTGLFAIAAGWSIIKLAPPRGSETTGAVSRDLWFLAFGLGTAAAAALGGWWWLGAGPPPLRWGSSSQDVVRHAVVHAVLLVALALTMVGLRGVLGTIGARSREYRTARGARQGTIDMVAAGGGVLLGEAIRVTGALIRQDVLFTVGTVMAAVSLLMLLIGLGYLVSNAFLIRRSLRQPPPSLVQILGGEATPASRPASPDR